MDTTRAVTGYVLADTSHPHRILDQLLCGAKVAVWLARRDDQTRHRNDTWIDQEAFGTNELLPSRNNPERIDNNRQRRAKSMPASMVAVDAVAVDDALVHTQAEDRPHQPAVGAFRTLENLSLDVQVPRDLVVDLKAGDRQWLGIDDGELHRELVSIKCMSL